MGGAGGVASFLFRCCPTWGHAVVNVPSADCLLHRTRRRARSTGSGAHICKLLVRRVSLCHQQGAQRMTPAAMPQEAMRGRLVNASWLLLVWLRGSQRFRLAPSATSACSDIGFGRLRRLLQPCCCYAHPRHDQRHRRTAVSGLLKGCPLLPPSTRSGRVSDAGDGCIPYHRRRKARALEARGSVGGSTGWGRACSAAHGWLRHMCLQPESLVHAPVCGRGPRW